MTKSKVFNLNEYKELKDIRTKDESYLDYLQTLAQSQLENEVSYFKDEISTKEFSKELRNRGKLLLKEIHKRAHSQVKAKIDQLTKETRDKL